MADRDEGERSVTGLRLGDRPRRAERTITSPWAKALGDNMTAERSDTGGEDWGASRSRIVTWHDPGPSTARGRTMTGLDYVRAMIDGTLPPPPICQLMRCGIVSAESGRVVFTCEPDESAYSGIAMDVKDVVQLIDRRSQCTSIRFNERCAEAGAQPSVETAGSSHDNALAETAGTKLMPGGSTRKVRHPIAC